MLRKIKLYGQLAKFIGRRVLQADVATAAEAVRFLMANWPELEQHMADQHYRVSVGSYDVSVDELHDPAGRADIEIVPVIAGAGATGRIILGAALIIASIFIPGSAAIGTLGLTKAIGVKSLVAGIGVQLALSGVAQLLVPVPRIPQGADTQSDPRKTFNFSGVQNSSRAGTPVPLVFGKTLTGSVVISAGVDTVQVKA